MTKKKNTKKAATPKVKITGVDQIVTEALVAPTNCPGCGVDLDNNLSTFAEVLAGVKGDMSRALKLQQNEFECLECDHKWGKVMGSQPKSAGETKSPLQKIAESSDKVIIAGLSPDEIAKAAVKAGLETPAGETPIPISKKTGIAVKQYTNPSTVDKPVGRVHEIAAEMLAADPAARRKDIVAACVALGINIHTAKTQVQVYLKGLKDDLAAKLAASVEATEAATA